MSSPFPYLCPWDQPAVYFKDSSGQGTEEQDFSKYDGNYWILNLKKCRACNDNITFLTSHKWELLQSVH